MNFVERKQDRSAAAILRANQPNSTSVMKAMTRQQLAAYAGVDARTLRKWIKPHQRLLWRMGMPKGKGALPPNVVKWIVDKYCIDTSQ